MRIHSSEGCSTGYIRRPESSLADFFLRTADVKEAGSSEDVAYLFVFVHVSA